MRKCPPIEPTEFTNSCKPITQRPFYDKIYFNSETKQVFDEYKNHIGSGEMDAKGEFLSVELKCG